MTATGKGVAIAMGWLGLFIAAAFLALINHRSRDFNLKKQRREIRLVDVPKGTPAVATTAAAAAADAVGIGSRRIAAGLRSFTLDAESNPGRLNLYERRGVLVLIAYFFVRLYIESRPVFQSYGVANFVFKDAWIPSKDQFGALPLIVGTLITAATALFMSLAPRPIRRPSAI